MKVNMPDEREIKFEIENIIDKGLEEKESFYSYLKKMYKQIGLNHLFHDRLEILFTILLISSILFLVIKENKLYFAEEIQYIYALFFTVSPILFLTMSILNFISIKQNKTYEIEMTCKYNIYQISGFRMFVFSVITILFNSIIIYILSGLYNNLSYLRAFIISIASLFLFSTVFLFAILKVKNKYIKYLIILGWIIINLSLYILKTKFYIKLLNNISISTWVLVIAGFILLYMKNLKKLVMLKNIEGVI